jgi:hypothetical protein
LLFRVFPELSNAILEIADNEARGICLICELLLSEGVEAYKKEGHSS